MRIFRFLEIYKKTLENTGNFGRAAKAGEGAKGEAFPDFL